MQAQESILSQFDVSLVIVSFNTRDVLRECLLSVYREAGSLHVQVIVVDNASTDDSPAMVEREFPEVELIRKRHQPWLWPSQQPRLPVSEGTLYRAPQL